MAESAERGGGEATLPARSVDELWLDVLQQISARTAHEIKGALNGVSVNLEVVRSRSAKAEASAASVAPFATSAADQLDVVVRMTEALLGLCRAPREPVDVTETVDRFVALLAPSARVDGASLRLEPPPRDAVRRAVRTRGNAVRSLLGAALLAALARKGDIRCRISGGEDTVVSLECADAEGPLTIPPEIMVVAADAGVPIHVEGPSMSLTFPAAGVPRHRSHETA